MARIAKSGRRHSNDGERHSVHANTGTQHTAVARKKLLPQSVPDYRDRIAPVRIVSRAEAPPKHRLSAEDREKIPRCLCNMRPHHVLCAPDIDIGLLKERRIGKVFAVPPPIVKLSRAAMRHKVRLERCQTARIVERQRPQQQRIHNAKDACICANADSEGNDREACLPGATGLKSACVLSILHRLAGNLRRDRYCQVR